MDNMMQSSEQLALFCRLYLHTKRDLPIRSSEMGMLIYLVKTEEEKTPNAVAKFFNVTKSMATNMVAALLTSGYIKKEQSAIDRRSFSLLPTTKAKKLVDETYQEYFKLITILETKMGKEQFKDFIEMLGKANQILLEEKSNE